MSGTRSGSGRRAVVRWAWRLFRREWRQQLLVLALVTVAVAAAVGGASTVVNAASGTRGQFGDAGAMAVVDAAHPEAARAEVAAARQRFGKVEVVGHTAIAVPGSAEKLDLRSQDPHGLYGHPMLARREGRYPTRANEVALTDGAASQLSARVGERIRLGGVERTVVGRVENPGDLNDEFALIAPGQAGAQSLTLLLQSDRPTSPSAASARAGSGRIGFDVMVAGTDKQAVVATVLVATTLAMALVCLLAAAGFVVVAQRRQRQMGLFAAIGATERHLRLVMLANGAIVGVTAALVGGVLGVLGWLVAAPAVETAAAHRIDRLDLPWGLISACMAIAIVVAIAAAWWPARTLARLPVMAALSRRPPRPRPVHRSLLLAVGLVALGVSAIAAAEPTSEHVRPLVLLGGLVAVVIGVVFASPAAIRLLAAPAGRFPFATRLALRDLVRYQARAAAALAAITLGLSISVSVVIVAKASEHRSDEGNLSNRELLIRVGGASTAPDGVPSTAADPNLSRGELARLDAAAARISSAVDHPMRLTLNVAMSSATAQDPRAQEPIGLGSPIGHGIRDLGVPYVATPSLLRHFGIDPGTVDDATDVLTTHHGKVVLVDRTVRPDGSEPPTRVQRVDLPKFTSGPNSVVTQGAMRRHGWVSARRGWLVESSKPLTRDQIATARARAAAAGLTIETRATQDSLGALRTGATTAGAVLALAIVAMTIGLIRGESVSDLRTLTATGATAGTRRTLTASTAGALAVLGVVLGTAGAYIAILAAYHSDLGRLVPLPVTDLVLLAVGLPLAAAGGGWLLAGREPQTFARQALD